MLKIIAKIYATLLVCFVGLIAGTFCAILNLFTTIAGLLIIVIQCIIFYLIIIPLYIARNEDWRHPYSLNEIFSKNEMDHIDNLVPAMTLSILIYMKRELKQIWSKNEKTND